MRRYQVVPIMEENEDDDEDAAAFFRISFFPFLPPFKHEHKTAQQEV